MRRFPTGETVIWHRWDGDEAAPVLDEYGAPITGGSPEATFTDVELDHVAVAESVVVEPRDGVAVRVAESATLYFSPSPGVFTAHDQFTVRGERYEVESASALNAWAHPRTGHRPGAAVSIKRVEG